MCILYRIEFVCCFIQWWIASVRDWYNIHTIQGFMLRLHIIRTSKTVYSCMIFHSIVTQWWNRKQWKMGVNQFSLNDFKCFFLFFVAIFVIFFRFCWLSLIIQFEFQAFLMCCIEQSYAWKIIWTGVSFKSIVTIIFAVVY